MVAQSNPGPTTVHRNGLESREAPQPDLFSGRPWVIAGSLRLQGISDHVLDPALDGIAPEGYYRAVYQSEDYVRREFSKVFDVVAYLERGMSNFQDLVVLRNRG